MIKILLDIIKKVFMGFVIILGIGLLLKLIMPDFYTANIFFLPIIRAFNKIFGEDSLFLFLIEFTLELLYFYIVGSILFSIYHKFVHKNENLDIDQNNNSDEYKNSFTVRN